MRFISNHSSGKMGFAVAAAARGLGAEVELVAGPVSLDPPAGVAVVAVGSAAEMHREVMSRAAGCDIFIATAARRGLHPGRARTGQAQEGGISPPPRAPAHAGHPRRGGRPRRRPVHGGVRSRDRRPRAARPARSSSASASTSSRAIGWVAPISVSTATGTPFSCCGRAAGGPSCPQGPKTELARQLLSLVTERFLAARPISHA